jgi:hypothetical protein
MSIDNPQDQVEALIASDERQSLPEIADEILEFIEKLPVPGAGPIVRLIRYEKEKQSIENSVLMLKTAWEELRRVSANVEDLREHSVNRDEVRRLTLDAARKAEDLRDHKRVERIGKILAHALTLGASDFDKAEEMMRVARDLSDQDVLGLRYLYDTQSKLLEHRDLYVNVDEVNDIWAEDMSKLKGTTGQFRTEKLEGMPLSEHTSTFLKLQGFGLATSVERKESRNPPGEQVFALLAKGADFVRYIQGAVKK